MKIITQSYRSFEAINIAIMGNLVMQYQICTPFDRENTFIQPRLNLMCKAMINPLPTNDAYMRHEIFSFMMSYPARTLGDRFCVSRKGGTGGGGWMHLKGANSMAMSGLALKSPCFKHQWT